MLHLHSVGEFEYITDFEWLKPVKFYRLIIQLAKGQGHLLNLTRHLECLDRDGRGICGLTPILSRFWYENCADYLVLHDI